MSDAIIHKESISLDCYEEMAEYYFSCVDNKAYNAFYERPGTLSLLPDVNGRTVLDAGCAAGWYTKWLLEHGASVTAVDFSPSMIEMTRKRVGDAARILRADLNHPLDMLEDQSFDIILSSLTLHYLRDWDRVMKESHRLLKDSGQLIFSTHHPFMDFTVFEREDYFLTEIIKDEWNTHKGLVEVEFYRRPLQDIIRPVLENGFIIEKLSEPMPTEEFKASNPNAYERLCKRPQFLFIRARKQQVFI